MDDHVIVNELMLTPNGIDFDIRWNCVHLKGSCDIESSLVGKMFDLVPGVQPKAESEEKKIPWSIKYLYDGDCSMCQSLKTLLERQVGGKRQEDLEEDGKDKKTIKALRSLRIEQKKKRKDAGSTRRRAALLPWCAPNWLSISLWLFGLPLSQRASPFSFST
eukprot:1144723-Pelagomonas_calceolata.AAC.3